MRIISNALRELLVSNGVLELDPYGDAVFAGLTAAESEFYVICRQCDPSELDAAEALVFTQLRHRHVMAQLHALPGAV